MTDWSSLENWIEQKVEFGSGFQNIKDEDDAQTKLRDLLKDEIDRVGVEQTAGLAKYIKSDVWKSGYIADGYRKVKGKKTPTYIAPRAETRRLAYVLKTRVEEIKAQEEQRKKEEKLSIKKWETVIRKEDDPAKLGRYTKKIQDLATPLTEREKELPPSQRRPVFVRPDVTGRYLQELINKRLEELRYDAVAAATEVDILRREIDIRAGPKQLRGLKTIINTRIIPDEEKERLKQTIDEKILEGQKQYIALRLLLKTSTDPGIVERIKETARVSNVLGPTDKEALMVGADTKLEMLRMGVAPI